MMESAIYTGKVLHHRHQPKQHRFEYSMLLLWLKLDELALLDKQVIGFSSRHFAPMQFKREDYLGESDIPLQQSVLAKMSSLAGKNLQGEVFFLGQLRNFGLYFSPVNFYYLRDMHGTFTYVLAEVSNTPWNQRHYYLINLATQQDSIKAFHVSPFNPMDMTYKWKIAIPDEVLTLSLSCFTQARHFDAALSMRRQTLTSKSLIKQLIKTPSMMLKTLVGIYWQAFKLAVKRVPFYSHPNKTQG